MFDISLSCHICSLTLAALLVGWVVWEGSFRIDRSGGREVKGQETS